MFGFFKRKKKQESDQQEALERQQAAEAEERAAEVESAAEEAVHEHDPEVAQATDYRPDELEQEASREALDGELATGEAHTALDEVPVDTPRESLAEEVKRPEAEVPGHEVPTENDAAVVEPEPLAPEPEIPAAPRDDTRQDDEAKADTLARAAEEAQEEVRRQEAADDLEGDTTVEVPHETSAATAGRDKPKSEKRGWFSRIKAGLGKTRANLTDGLANLFLGKKQIDDELMEDLETQLLMADVGIEATTEIIDNLSARVSRKELNDPQALYRALQEELTELLAPVATPLALPPKGEGPFVILMVGVNGVGKTTTIGKLTKRFQAEGRSVMLAAGDTFRAAAVEQLKVWGERNQVPVVAQHTGADSASVIYDALEAARARKVDVLIADTAGRLHNKGHLMEELKKVRRVMAKLDEAAPHEVMLVLDAGTGQNALAQASTFNEAVPVTGITLTKLDGTAKGGIIFALAKQLGTPIRFIGVGETLDDLRPFAADDFVGALFSQDDENAA
ncbi:signal recognition particle-docking protein FtsY [Modicisalibacter xianhensis]|uniref:Signal recognition particle receptor FtsY n=1 Tax=Modicisalibacter xianhensis TaxID=442341 RepID=A0A1I3EDA3_9GAMM|nr:signal recognition particle-docking protein FtsY [Halomonas xianhensis]SFH96671.1 signal recognition particle-docking protein FtsY [Halomonas xianhensis]